jgi:hypothetical protein
MTVIFDFQPGRPSVWFFVTPGDEKTCATDPDDYLTSHAGQLDQVGIPLPGERFLDWDEAIQILDHYDCDDISMIEPETYAVAAAIRTQRTRINNRNEAE